MSGVGQWFMFPAGLESNELKILGDPSAVELRNKSSLVSLLSWIIMNKPPLVSLILQIKILCLAFRS